MSRSDAKHTAVINGVEMSARELSQWIEREFGYRVSFRTLQIRISQGRTGRRLIAPPDPRRANNPGRPKRRYVWEYPKLGITVAGWGERVSAK